MSAPLVKHARAQNQPASGAGGVDPDVWASRRRNNVRLGLILAGVAVALFLVSLWKYRPL